MRKHEIWMEGYSATGQVQKAQFLGVFWGTSFEDACENALIELNWDMKFYNKERNTYWACRFYDNEKDARAYFG